MHQHEQHAGRGRRWFGEDGVQAPEVMRRRARPDTAYQCRYLDDVRSALRYQFQTHAEVFVPEEVSCRLIFGLDSSLEWTKEGQPTTATISRGRQESSTPDSDYSVTTALSNFLDAKEKKQYQRAVAKIIIGAISRVDGYKYSERRTNDTSKGDGYRFQFICRDSL
ncbi:uncharacterized protein K452DRAFT_345547 [Aplosporella prunicola CBS 121167]|uniref:Uncharacterized protein n=1 Tax=Aplosporella prunicola CBS 121167 TaxID=1176127 RepID=A0A6A6BIX1_9PEZI|nr:uncharacterized protein K452DRAFT_345547 [Aplosporella prunicola CBS 121167]KAF2144090.1 hypothetical protein K452DRAFT_345547 [Aplosporella prunicola CBS 121167]